MIASNEQQNADNYLILQRLENLKKSIITIEELQELVNSILLEINKKVASLLSLIIIFIIGVLLYFFDMMKFMMNKRK